MWNGNLVEGFLSREFILNMMQNGQSVAKELAAASPGGLEFQERNFRMAIAPFIFPHMKVLEIGTGVGVYTERILEAEPSVHYYSLEPQPYLEFYLNVLFRNYSFYSIQGSGADIPTIKNSELDLVLAYNVFTYLKITVVLKYLREISRVLKPSGKAVLHFFEVDSISPNGLEELESFTNNFDNRLILSASFLKNYARRWNLELISEYRLSPGSISTWLVFEKL